MAEFNNELENGDLPIKRVIFIMAGSLLLGMLFNTLFYGNIPGLSYLIFTTAFYLFFFVNFRDTQIRQYGNVLIIFIFLLSSTFALFNNPILLFFNLLVVPLLVVVHTLLVTNKILNNWYNYRFLIDILYGIFHGAFAYVLKPIDILYKLINNKSNLAKPTALKKVFLGLIVSFPLLFIILNLLASADEVFNSLLIKLSFTFTNLNLNSLIIQIILIGIVTLLVFSYFWSLSINKKRSMGNDTSIDNVTNNLLDPVIVITVLLMICIVYTLFIFIQFTYLFGSSNHIIPMNLTYAQYARKGFFELVIITLINLIILTININLTKNKESKFNLTIKLFNTFLVICTTIILISAHFRMTLYEKAYGYTYLRLFTHAFMLYILTLLIITLIKVWYVKLSLLKFYIIISLTAYALINFANVDKIIANNNINRYHETGKIDVSYISNLSYDAIPEALNFLVELKAAGNLNAIKLEELLNKKRLTLNDRSSWQSYNHSASKASSLLNTYFEVKP